MKKFIIIGGVTIGYAVVSLAYCYKIGAVRRWIELYKYYTVDEIWEEQCSLADWLNYGLNGGKRPTVK